jgi:hypothetical protein
MKQEVCESLYHKYVKFFSFPMSETSEVRNSITRLQQAELNNHIKHKWSTPDINNLLNPFVPIRHLNFNPKMCSSVPIMYLLASCDLYIDAERRSDM